MRRGTDYALTATTGKLLQRIWIRGVLRRTSIQQRDHLLPRRRYRRRPLAHDVGSIHLFVVNALVSVIVRAQGRAFERYAREKTARARIGEHLSAQRHVGRGGRIAALRPRRRGGVRTELDLAGKNGIGAARVHHQDNEIGGLAAELKSKAAALEGDHGWRSPFAREVFAGAASHGAASVS